MSPKEHLIDRFRALCAAVPGGVQEIAIATDSSAEGLKQILAGTKLPSGSPRGVGPKLQKRLDERYPGWSGIGPDAPGAWPFALIDRARIQALTPCQMQSLQAAMIAALAVIDAAPPQ